MGITQAEAARILGTSRQNVHTRIKRGTLETLPDGTLDPTEVRMAAALHDPAKSERGRQGAALHKELMGKPARTTRKTGPPSADLPPEGDELFPPELEIAIRAYWRHQARNTRRTRFRLRPRFVHRDAVAGFAFDFGVDALQIVTSRVRYFAQELGYTEAKIEEMIDEAAAELMPRSHLWIAGPDRRVCVDPVTPRWRRPGRDVSGSAAATWDAGRRKAKRAKRAR